MIVSQKYSQLLLLASVFLIMSSAFLVTPALGKSPKQRRLGKKAGKKKCKRHTKAKTPTSCKGEVDGVYNGLPDTLVPPTATSEADINRCLIALQLSGFDLQNTTNYNDWFDESSIFVLADIGVFVGTQDILEYMQLAYPPEGHEGYGYISKPPILNPETTTMLPITAEGNECIFLISQKVTFATYQLSSLVDALIGNRLTFTILDDGQTLLMNRVDNYTPKGYLKNDFEKILAPTSYGNNFARIVCETMQNTCPSTFSNNCYREGELDECMADILSLPATDEDGGVIGKSFGCRVVHAQLARRNEKHCPHISFDPEYDSNCKLKCQKVKDITYEDMFHPAELAFLADHAEELGLGQKQFVVREISA